jgi:hypothetical protein
MAFEFRRSTVRRTLLNILVGLAIIVIIGFTLCIAALVGAEPPQVSQRMDTLQMQDQGTHETNATNAAHATYGTLSPIGPTQAESLR